MRARTASRARKQAVTLVRVRTDSGWPADDFRDYLDEKMRDAGLPRAADLAAAAGIDASVISKWRRGIQQPSRKNLKAIAPALRVAPVMLYIAAGLDQAEDLDVNADAEGWPPQFHDLRTLYERLDAAGRGDAARRDLARMVAGWRAELDEPESGPPNSRRRAG
jgi:transcriptional regulator with XRE-family HTH domain